MPAKPYVQQALSSLQQAVAAAASDESEMVHRHEQDIQKLHSEISEIETKRNLALVSLAGSKEDQTQGDILRKQIADLERDKSEKEARISQIQNEMSQQRQAMQQLKSELESLAGSVHSALGRSGLV